MQQGDNCGSPRQKRNIQRTTLFRSLYVCAHIMEKAVYPSREKTTLILQKRWAIRYNSPTRS